MKCLTVSKLDLSGCKRLEYGGCSWHEECFVCCGCEKPIGGQSFIPDKDEFYCVPCYEGRFSPRCAHCKQVRGKLTLLKINDDSMKELTFNIHKTFPLCERFFIVEKGYYNIFCILIKSYFKAKTFFHALVNFEILAFFGFS